MRDLQAPKWFKLFFSNQQFELTAICLTGVRRFALHFQAVFIIQVTAFIMTLRRKNLASHTTVVAVYMFLLVAGFALTVRDLLDTGTLLLVHTLANVAATLRIHCGLNKFAVWSLVSALMFGLREDAPGWGLNSLYAAIAGLDRGSVPPLAQSTAAMSALFAATLLVKLRLNAVAARGADKNKRE